MIVRPKPDLRDLLFAVNGSILPKVGGRLAIIAAVSAIAVLAAGFYPAELARMAAMPFTVIGISLSIFTSFRNAVCYDRWWEGRKLWGALITAPRCLARLTSTLDAADRKVLLHGACAFACGLAARLRGQDEYAAVLRWLRRADLPPSLNPTDAVLQDVGRHCLDMLREGRLGAIHHSLIEHELRALSEAQAGCERIGLTPVPFSYSLLLHRTAGLFCLCLPFALAGTLGWWTVPAALLVSYAFFGLDALADQLEDPFGTEPNDLPLDAMTRLVEREMLATLGESPLPPAVEPLQGRLS